MKLYIYTPITGDAAVLVRAQPATAQAWEYRVWHPDAGYSVWPREQFEAQHRPLTRREAQLVNHQVGELEIMAISDRQPGDYNVLTGDLELVPDPAA